MTSNSFRLNVLARILLICLLAGALLFSIFLKHWVATSVLVCVILSFATAELFRYVDRANTEFSDFLQAVRNGDFTKYSNEDRRGQSFTRLKESFNAIAGEFQTVRTEKEAHYIFLEKVVENTNAAIISFDGKGYIGILNEAAKNLFDLPFLNNIHQLETMNPGLHQKLLSGTNEMATIQVGDKRPTLLFRSAGFRLQQEDHRLIVITNVKPEIDKTEIDAWEQLLQVLTHEIMNSITPISSLSGAIKDHFNHMLAGDGPDDELLQDMAEGLQVIEKRSAGLIDFVNNYKTLISIPKPELKPINLKILFDRLSLLTSAQLGGKGISLNIQVSSQLLSVKADEGQIEQVLLNMIHNAADALNGISQPRIELSGDLLDETTVIRISDNGSGIDPDVLGRIFIPFFTTKNTGTGIGLSLSKQIMRQHSGSIDVHSVPGQGAVFTLSFPLV
jgi:two-component system nitrogen regulation sensor histidine kinase NtrY